MENRKRGAKKAAETRKAKRHVSRCESADRWFCGQCALEYDESIEERMFIMLSMVSLQV